MGTSSGPHINDQSSTLPPRQQPRSVGGGLQTSLLLVSSDACGSPNLHERGSNSDQVRKSSSDSASSRETWPTADVLLAKRLEKEKQRGNGFAMQSVMQHVASSNKLSLMDVARQKVEVIAEKMQNLLENF